MSEVFFTADTHFNHRAMIERGWRPEFSSVEEMNAALIENWNAVVAPKDTVWHLGDFGMGPASAYLPIVRQLNGTIHLIAGNHDKVWPGDRNSHRYQADWLDAGFSSVQAFARRGIDGHQVMLSHLPYDGDHVGEERYEQWRLRDLGDPLLCGHVHDAWQTSAAQLNVGVDVSGYRPVDLDTVRLWVRLLTEQAAGQ